MRALNKMYGGMTHFVHSVERGLSVTAILITLPHGQPHEKMANDKYLRDKPTQEIHQTQENLNRRGVHAICRYK